MTPKALLWDVDGTLAETERDGHRVAFNLAFADAGLPWGWDERRYGELLHITGGRERLLADMLHRADAPRTPEARESLARALHHRKNQRYAELVAAGALLPRPGVLDLMREARAQGLRQAIVTTTSRRNVQALMTELLGRRWADRFEVLVCGEDVRDKKPHPEAYLLALQRLGLPPLACRALEDSGPGLSAARAAGIPVWLRPSVYFPAPRPERLAPVFSPFCQLITRDEDFTWERLRAERGAWQRAA
ncbi:HAD-IA family hydrolase [Ideonella livida]|uniref:HAD-IA family hydrolase n=1 Tax=Ideonella livida TaxID=2707176 RepID=A0A7C9TLI8_9BURK|nr:HAD-IA family hydrolase [Ideonella livida]NDY93560.1 HAD-IA family hydrolase [Ideonella livida]